MNGGDELGLKDLTFLRAIRDINESPERFASAEQGETPATVTAITEATTLSEEEVVRRLDDPQLGKSGLVEVYETGGPEDDSTLHSAELTDAGEAAIAEAEERQRSVDDEEWPPEEARTEFSDVQEWEPADVENGTTAGGTPTAADGGAVDSSGGTTAGAVAESVSAAGTMTEPSALSTVEGRSSTAGTSEGRAGTGARGPTDTGTDTEDAVTVEAERIAALERRIEELEADQSAGAEAAAGAAVEPASEASAPAADAPAPAVDPERVEALHEEVAALRETTERLDATLSEVVSGLEAIQDAEYGALNEKREEQLRTAVKSMVAFHQLADHVLNVRVENFEPAAGRPDDERVEITRNRIGDALGVGKSGGARGMDLSAVGGGSEWPSPEEAAGGRVFDGSDGADVERDSELEADGSTGEPETESDTPESGVYPPIGSSDGGDDSPRDAVDEDEPEPESDAPDSGIYPPIGSTEEDEGEEGESDRESEKASEPAQPESESEPEATEGNQVSADADPTDDGSVGDTLSVDVEESAVAGNIREAAAERGHVMEPIRSVADGEATAADSTGLPAMALDAESLLSVRAAITGAKEEPEPQAYARIVGDEQPTEALTVRHSEVTGLPAVPTEVNRRFTVAFDGGSSEEVDGPTGESDD